MTTLMIYLSGPRTKYTVVVKQGGGLDAARSLTVGNPRCADTLSEALRMEQRHNSGHPVAWDFLSVGKYFTESHYGVLVAVAEGVQSNA